MREYQTVNLLVLNAERTRCLVLEKVPYSVTQAWVFPGGQIDAHSEMETLENEIREELGCDFDKSTLRHVGTYNSQVAGDGDVAVCVKLYVAELFGKPTPSTEIQKLHWIGVDDVDNQNLSPIIRDIILPDLVERAIVRPA